MNIARPTADQLAWQDQQGDMLTPPLECINPKKLDVAQWVDVAESMGARYIVFVAKHIGGFCMWPTPTTKYSIQYTPWKNGKGDICRDLASGEGTVWLPVECDVPIRKDWFWTTTNESSLKSLDHLMDIYYRSVGHGCNLLLNHTPDTTGLIPGADVKRAAEFGREIRKRFGKPLAEVSGQGSTVELSLRRPATIDHVVIMEDIRQGERIIAYKIEAFLGQSWKPIAKGSAVGHKKIDRLEKPVKTDKIRFVCTESSQAPLIRNLAVFGK